MKREEAEQALAMIQKVISRTRDDTVLENWGLVWILHGITNFIAYILAIERGHWDVVVPEVVSVYDGTFREGIFDGATAELDSVFAIRGVPYRWKPLRREYRPGSA